MVWLLVSLGVFLNLDDLLLFPFLIYSQSFLFFYLPFKQLVWSYIFCLLVWFQRILTLGCVLQFPMDCIHLTRVSLVLSNCILNGKFFNWWYLTIKKIGEYLLCISLSSSTLNFSRSAIFWVNVYFKNIFFNIAPDTKQICYIILLYSIIFAHSLRILS